MLNGRFEEWSRLRRRAYCAAAVLSVGGIVSLVASISILIQNPKGSFLGGGLLAVGLLGFCLSYRQYARAEEIAREAQMSTKSLARVLQTAEPHEPLSFDRHLR